MTLRRRQALVRLAREFDALVITDDVYDFLQWPLHSHESLETALLPRIVDVDNALDGGTERAGADGFGNVVSNGSFSKICGPGIGLGGWRELLDLHLVWRISKLMEFPASVAVWSNP